jgi:hypothetical protein
MALRRGVTKLHALTAGAFSVFQREVVGTGLCR